jgi:hypothetical protein
MVHFPTSSLWSLLRTSWARVGTVRRAVVARVRRWARFMLREVLVLLMVIGKACYLDTSLQKWREGSLG